MKNEKNLELRLTFWPNIYVMHVLCIQKLGYVWYAVIAPVME